MSLPDKSDLEVHIALELYLAQKKLNSVQIERFTDEDMEPAPDGNYYRASDGTYLSYHAEMTRRQMMDAGPDYTQQGPGPVFWHHEPPAEPHVETAAWTGLRETFRVRTGPVEAVEPTTTPVRPDYPITERFRLVTTTNQRLARRCKQEAAEALKIILS